MKQLSPFKVQSLPEALAAQLIITFRVKVAVIVVQAELKLTSFLPHAGASVAAPVARLGAGGV